MHHDSARFETMADLFVYYIAYTKAFQSALQE